MDRLVEWLLKFLPVRENILQMAGSNFPSRRFRKTKMTEFKEEIETLNRRIDKRTKEFDQLK